MNKEWSEQNKMIQSKLKKATFSEAVRELLDLREKLTAETLSWKETFSPGIIAPCLSRTPRAITVKRRPIPCDTPCINSTKQKTCMDG